MAPDHNDVNSHGSDPCSELEQKIREYQKILERFELAAAGSTAGIWDWDISSDTVFFSGRIGELLGYPPDEFPESMDGFWDIVHPDDLPAARLAVDTHLKGRVPCLVDLRLRMRSGEYRWFHARGQASWDDNGHPVRMAGSLADVTDRKTTEQELARSEERFRLVMGEIPLALTIWSPEGKLVSYNEAWAKQWNLDDKEAAEIVASYNFLEDPQLRELGVLPLVKRAFSGESVVLPPVYYRGEQTSEDTGVDLADPNAKWVHIHLYPITDDRGELTSVIAANTDITDLKLVEEEARAHREALARVDRASSMGQLTGAISHELNQPLTGILSNAQAAELLLAREDLERDELADIISSIISDTKRAGEVIRNLREVYREQKGAFLPVDVNRIIVETMGIMHSEFIVRNVATSHELAASLPEVSGNWVQIQQVLVNTIMNAVQAMSGYATRAPQLHVKTMCAGNEVMVQVEDGGPGIDEDKIDHIFEPLATWKPGGTGMGLAISSSIIKSHGGRMLAENRPEGGARVGFAIPAKKDE